MKLDKKQPITPRLDAPDRSIRLYLFHGPDEAGSRALAQRLLAGLKAEKNPLSSGAIKSDPALLADEAGSLSMFGGPKLLWIEPAGDEIADAATALLDAPAIEHSAVAIAGSLRKTSALLKLAEAHPLALAHISYLPEGDSADRLVTTLGRAEGLRIAPAVARRIAASAGNDQAVIGQELRKYALYLDAATDRMRDLEPDLLDELGADLTDGDVGRPGDLALAGDLPRLVAELERLDGSGIEPIPVVRALQRRLLMLAPMRARLDSGQSSDAVMTSVFWKDKALISRILSRWTSDRLAQAMARVARLERQLLSPLASRAALGEELIQIARAAGSDRRREA